MTELLMKLCMQHKQLFDSNIWVGFFASDDPHHKKASSLFSKLDSSEVVYITSEIISEVTTVLKFRYGYKNAQKFVAFLLNTKSIIKIPNELYFDVTLNHILDTTDKKLPFTDMTLVVLSEKFQIQTFDKDLNKCIQKSN